MSLDEAVDRLKDTRDDRNRWIGVYIGIVAVLLAVCGMGGGNAAKDATRANIEATNTWAFFQAKNLRRHVYRMQEDTFQALLAAYPEMPAGAKSAIAAKLETYRQQEQLLTSDPKTKEGLDQLFERGKELEKERDIAMRKDPYFDWSQALLQIAIVLASVSLITGGNVLLIFSGCLAVLGTLMMINGFTLLAQIPLIG